MSAVATRFLGSGDAFGSGGRFQVCIQVSSPNSSVLLDCGASSLIAMRRFGVEPNDIDGILVSHVHGDHFGGIPFFILDAQFISKRERPLLIAGPRGIEERVRQAQEALFAGYSQTQQKYAIRFLKWKDRRPAVINGITVTPFEVVHASGAPPFALRLEVDGKTIAYSGDTEWTDALVEAAKGANLFICEANFFDKRVKSHLDDETLAMHRDRLDCRRLIITHMNSMCWRVSRSSMWRQPKMERRSSSSSEQRRGNSSPTIFPCRLESLRAKATPAHLCSAPRR